MSTSTFTRNRIRGITFKRSMASLPRRRLLSADGLRAEQDWFLPEASLSELQQAEPFAFKPDDIRRLLADHGRQEVHSLVSDAVEQLGHLRQLERSLLRLTADQGIKRQSLAEDSVAEEATSTMDNVRIEVMRQQRLWKIRLEILEMIANAQNSLRHCSAEFPRKQRPLVARSAQPKK